VPLNADQISVGDIHEAVVVEGLTRTQLVQYAGASGDYNPLHHDEVYAREVAGYPTVFAHGMLTMGMTARLLTDWLGDGRLLRFGGRFGAQVWPGDTLTARATVEVVGREAVGPIVEVSVVTANQRGDAVFSGYAVARIDEGRGSPCATA
jgi:acyl dehydratase